MTIQHDINAPWSLHFDRDGTEDYGIICDAKGNEIVASHLPERQEGYGNVFWLPETDTDPLPMAVRQMWLMTVAPKLLAALLLAQHALNQAPRFRVGKTDSYKIAAKVDRAIAEAKGGRS